MPHPHDQSSDLEKIVHRLKRFSEATSASELNEKRVGMCIRELQTIRVTVKQLQETGLAATVNRLRKLLKSEENVQLARRLIKDWKLVLETTTKEEETKHRKRKRKKAEVELEAEAKAGSAGDSRLVTGEAAGQSKPAKQPMAATASGSTTASTKKPGTSKVNEPAEYADIPLSMATSDPVRVKCREMLALALEHSGAAASSSSAAATEASAAALPRRIAAEIESTVFTDFGGVGSGLDSKYKNRIRSLVMNLRDPKNPGLRDCLQSGALAGCDVARMTPEQLASDEMKQLREQMTKDAIRLHQPAKVEAGSSLFSCKRCRKKNCSYYQLQTLPGDEPMTTYVLCNECGFRWKFN